MRHTAGRLNRVWLTIIGLILLMGAGTAAAIGLGLFEGLALRGFEAPDADQPILALPAEGDTVAIALILLGVILGTLAILWLLAQVPRKHGASTLKLQDPDNSGLTTLKPTLLEAAISDRVGGLADVTAVRTVLRGSSRTPDVTLRVTTTSHADIPEVVAEVEQRVIHDLRLTLGREPASVGIEVDVRADPKRDSSVTVEASQVNA
ncbi:hypothetical protein [Arthrobacter sp. L77]|uniref:hypothetical protein n=1 Tax=Arthrobacter sp. L77 TaxID=1496689 RepID=UPI0005BDE6C0|nr:hypothetical protein [Arthrobacter sp. L77]